MIISAVVVVAATVVIIATSGAAAPVIAAGAAAVDYDANGETKPKNNPKPRTPVNKAGEVNVPYDAYDYDTPLNNSAYPSHCDYDRPKEIEALIPKITPQLEPIPEKSALLKETIERQNTTLKEELSQEPVLAANNLNIPKKDEASFWSQAAEKAREVGSYVVHEVYDGVTDHLSIVSSITGLVSKTFNNASEYLSNISPFERDPREAFQEKIEAGHEKIDEVFGTDYANMYSDEVKAIRDKLTTWMLPPPLSGFSNQIKKSSNFFEKNIKHIFRDKPGHLRDTAANRQLLLEVAGDPNNFLGVDKYGKSWHAKILQSKRNHSISSIFRKC